jgi:hypothetical protein
MSYATFSFPPKLVHCLVCKLCCNAEGYKDRASDAKMRLVWVLIYANQPPSQQRLANLPGYINSNSFFIVCDLFELKQNVAEMGIRTLPPEVFEIIIILDEYGFACSIDCRSLSTHRQSQYQSQSQYHSQELYGTIEH